MYWVLYMQVDAAAPNGCTTPLEAAARYAADITVDYYSNDREDLEEEEERALAGAGAGAGVAVGPEKQYSPRHAIPFMLATSCDSIELKKRASTIWRMTGQG